MMTLTAADVARHADAMAAIRAQLDGFSPEHQVVILAGILGDALCKFGNPPSKERAILLAGPAIEMVFNMIQRTWADDAPTAGSA